MRQEMEGETTDSFMQVKQQLLRIRRERQRRDKLSIRRGSNSQQQSGAKEERGQVHHLEGSTQGGDTSIEIPFSIEEEQAIDHLIDGTDLTQFEAAKERVDPFQAAPDSVPRGTEEGEDHEGPRIFSSEGDEVIVNSCEEVPSNVDIPSMKDSVITSISGGVTSKIKPKKKKKIKKKQTKQTEISLFDELTAKDESSDLVNAYDALQEAIHEESTSITNKEWWGALQTGITLLVLLIVMTFAMKMVEKAAGIK